jgi:hypothetical protein
MIRKHAGKASVVSVHSTVIYNVGTQFASIAPANRPQVRKTRFVIKMDLLLRSLKESETTSPWLRRLQRRFFGQTSFGLYTRAGIRREMLQQAKPAA